MALFPQISGWVGTFLIVLAYFLVSNKKVESTGRLYQYMNLFGATGVAIKVFQRHDWSTLTLEITWAVIAVVALLSFRRKHHIKN